MKKLRFTLLTIFGLINAAFAQLSLNSGSYSAPKWISGIGYLSYLVEGDGYDELCFQKELTQEPKRTRSGQLIFFDQRHRQVAVIASLPGNTFHPVYIIDIERGIVVDSLKHVRHPLVCFFNGDREIIYSTDESRSEDSQQVFLHTIGTPEQNDVLIFDIKKAKDVFLEKEDESNHYSLGQSLVKGNIIPFHTGPRYLWHIRHDSLSQIYVMGRDDQPKIVYSSTFYDVCHYDGKYSIEQNLFSGELSPRKRILTEPAGSAYYLAVGDHGESYVQIFMTTPHNTYVENISWKFSEVVIQKELRTTKERGVPYFLYAQNVNDIAGHPVLITGYGGFNSHLWDYYDAAAVNSCQRHSYRLCHSNRT